MTEETEVVWTPADRLLQITDLARPRAYARATPWLDRSLILTVVSYAVYRIPRIREALVAAANRNVKIRLIVETPNRIEGQDEYDCLVALGQR